MKKILLLLVAVFATFITFSQTTYTWATPGAGGDFQVGTNWFPNGVPVAGDNIIINPSASITVSNLPSVVVNNFTVTLTATAALTLSAAAAQILGVSGSFVITGAATNLSPVNLGTNMTIAIQGTGSVTMNTGAAIGGNGMANFTFASGSTLNYAVGNGSIPLAGFHANSTINVTGVTGTSVGAGTGLTTVGNIIWNCPAQTVASTFGSVITTVAGSFTLNNTGSGGFQWGTSPTTTIAGAYTINGGTMNAAGGTITPNGGLTMNGGAINVTGTTIFNISGGNATINSGARITNTSTNILTFNVAGANNLVANAGSTITASSTGAIVLGTTGTTQALNLNGTITGLVSLSVGGTSTTTLNNSVTVSALTVNPGTFPAGNLVIAGGQTLTAFGAVSNVSGAGGVISGAGALVLTQASTLTLFGTGQGAEAGNATASIRNTGGITINSLAITFIGSAGQSTGTSFPTTLPTNNSVAFNNAGVGGVTVTQSTNFFSVTGTGTLTVPGGVTFTTNALGTMSMGNTAGVLAIAGTVTINGTVTFGATATATGAGTFNLNSGATLSTANTGGISAAAATGSVQTPARNFNAGSNYTFTGGATGDGMPLTVTGNVTNGTSTCTIGAAYTFMGNYTTTVSLVITSPNSITIGSTGIATHSSGTTVTGTGSYSSNSGATLNIATSSATFGLFPAAAAGSGLFQQTGLSISTGTNVTYTGTTLAIPLGTRCPSTLGILGVSSTGSLTLASPVTVSGLSFTGTGIINTTAVNLVTVNATAPSSIIRTSTGYVAGPLAVTLPANYNTPGIILFPVGKLTTYQGYEVFSPVVDAGGTVTIQIESFTAAPGGGTAGTGLSGALSARYWQATVTGAGAITNIGNIRVSESTLANTQKIGQSATVGGSYNSIGGSFFGGASLQSGLAVAALASNGFFAVATGAASGTFTAGNYAIGPNAYGGYVATYTSITNALAAMGENASLGGAVVFELQTDYLSTVEAYPIAFGSSVPTTGTNTVTIRPAAGVASAINFNPAGGNLTTIWDFNGGKNFIIDGRNGGTGSNRYISINNLGNGPAMRFINDGQSNTFRYLQLTAANTSTTNGVVFFSTTSIGALAANGNSSNTIDNCWINANGISPNGIYALGSTSPADNKTNTLTNCRIYDFYRDGQTSSGISIAGGNTSWVIGTTGNGNSFYQTSTRVPAASTLFRGVLINNTSGNGFSIVGNTIGGNIAGIVGSVFNVGSSTQGNTLQHSIHPIRLDVGTTTASSVQGNTIANINLFSSAISGATIYFAGIFANVGLVNIGDLAGNTIGSTTTNNNINFTFRGTGTAGAVVWGIAAGNATAYIGGNVNNNSIGGFTTTADFVLPTSVSFTGLNINSTGITVASSFNNNLIGSTSTADNIQHLSAAQMPSTQIGIAYTGTVSIAAGVTIQNNTVANITNGTSYGFSVNSLIGMSFGTSTVTTGPLTVSGNTLRNLTTASTNGNPITTSPNSVMGMSIGTVSGSNTFTISNNTIHSLINNSSAVSVLGTIGIWNAATNTSQIIERNFVHSLVTGSSNGLANQVGLMTAGGVGMIVRNNMIRLGINADGSSNTTSAQLIGIYKFNTSVQNYYFNTVYVGGTSVAAGTINTYAFWKPSTGGVDNIRNNIFANVRSNTSGTGKHYAFVLNQTSALTSNNNIYYAPGTGGVLGSLNNAGSDLTLRGLRAGLASQDLLSSNGNPVFTANATAGATTASLAVSAATGVTGAGVTIAGITTDQAGNTRATPPAVGAFESGLSAITATTDVWTPNITFSALGNRAAANTIVGNITVTDLGTGVPTSGGTAPRMWYRNQTTNSTWASVQGTLSSGTGNNAVFGFTLDYTLLAPAGVSANDAIQYYFVAQDQATVPNIWYNSFNATDPVHSNVSTQSITPTTLTQTFLIVAPLATTLTVDPSQAISATNFTSITNTGSGGLFNAINTGALGGNTTVSVVTNSTAETGAVTLGSAGLSGFTLLIKPTTTATVSGTSASWLLSLNGASGVTIDGSNNGTATGDLTISNTNTATTSAVVWLQSGSINNTIKNVNIIGNANTTTLVGIGSGGASIGTVGFGNGNNNNTIQNNNITACQYGIFSLGASTSNRNTGNIITQNLMNGSGANALGVSGILLRNENGPAVTYNQIANISRSGTIYGISLGATAFNSYSPGNTDEVINATVSNNIISTLSNSGGNSAFGIIQAPATSGTTTIANNAISAIISEGTPTDFVAGIYVGGGVGSTSRIYFNSISITGASPTRSVPAYALAIGGANPIVDVRNNILFNSATSSAAGKSYAFGVNSTAFTNMTLTNNNLFTSGTSANFAQTGGIGTTGTDRTTLSALYTVLGTGSANANSNPSFTSTTNLTPTTGNDLIGNDVAGITTDITNGPRQSPPTMGAYEINVPGIWLGTGSTDWSLASNWRNNLPPAPTGAADISVYIPSTGTMPTLAANASIRRLNLASGSTLTISGANTLSVSGDILNVGTITGTTAGVTLNGTVAQSVALSGNISVQDFTLNNIGGAPLSGAGFLNVTGVFTITAPGILGSGGRLTLKSTSNTATARVAQITVGGITGNVNVERYFEGGAATGTPGVRGFRFIAHPFTTNPFLNTLVTGGLSVTGTGGATNGFTANPNPSATNNPSAFSYDPTVVNAGTGVVDPGWTAYTNANTGLWNKMQGIRALFRGTNTQGLDGNNVYTVNPLTLSLTGAVNTGAQNFVLPATADVLTPRWSLVGNPYPSQIEVRTLLFTKYAAGAGNIGAAAYVFNPTKVGTSRGGYDMIDVSTAGSYILPTYGVVLVQNTIATTHNIPFAETDKATGAPNLSFRTTTANNALVLDMQDATGVELDKMYIRFNNNAANSFENRDGGKMLNEYAIYTLTPDNSLLAIDSRPEPTQESIIPLGVQSVAGKSFVLKASELELPVGVKAYLKDKFLNTETSINSTNFEYAFSTTANAASVGNARFEILFKKGLPVLPTVTTFSVKLSPNPAKDMVTINFSNVEAANTTITFVSAEGKIVKTVQAGNVQTGVQRVNIQDLAKGIYYVTLNNGTDKKTEKLVIQ